MKRIFIFITILLLYLVVPNVNAFSKYEGNETKLSSVINTFNLSSNVKNYKVNYLEKFVINFEVNTLIDFDYLEIYETNKEDNRLNISEKTFIFESNNDYIGESIKELNVNVYKENVVIYNYKKNIYVLSDGDNDYISLISLHECKKNKIKDELNISIVTKEIFNNYYQTDNYENNDFNSYSISTFSLPYEANVEGTVVWEDINNNTHPGINIRVEVYRNNLLIGTCNTNNNGYYSFTFQYNSSSDIIECYIVSENDNFKIIDTNFDDEEAYKVKICKLTELVNDSVYTSNLTINNNYEVEGADATYDDYSNSAFIIHQAINLGNEYFEDLNNDLYDELIIKFPGNTNENKTSYCELDTLNLSIYYNDVNDWDVILHEMGHFIQNTYGFTSSDGGIHAFDVNMYDYSYMGSANVESHESLIRLLFSEAWATYFSLASQKETNSIMMGIPFVGDSLYTDMDYNENNGLSYPINIDIKESLYYKADGSSMDINYGEHNEINIASVLYNLCYEDDISDNLYTDKELWDILKNSDIIYFKDFINELYNYDMIHNSNIGEILEENNFTINNLMLSTEDNDLTLSWNAGGGSIYIANNDFTLIVYNSIGETIFEKYLGNCLEYTFQESEYRNLLDLNNNINIVIKSSINIPIYNTSDNFILGPYYSSSININKPFEIDLEIDIETDDTNEMSYYSNGFSIIKLNNQYVKDIYNITFIANNTFSVKLYNKNLKELIILQSENNNNKNIVSLEYLLLVDYYYIIFEFNDYSSVNNFIIEFKKSVNNYISINQVIEITNLYSQSNNLYKQSVLKFENSFSSGYFKLDITDTQLSSDIQISISDDNGQIIYKMYNSNLLLSQGRTNTLISYLKYGEEYYININNIESDRVSVIISNIINEDIITFSEGEIRSEKFYSVSLESDVNGDSIKILNVSKPVRIKLTLEIENNSEDDKLFIIEKQVIDDKNICQTLENFVIINKEMFTNEIYVTYINLNEGKYYIGIFNNTDFETWNISMERIINNEIDYDSFIVDPGIGWKNGSQIEVLEKGSTNKSYNSNIIFEGFTRIIYIDSIKAPSPSRLDYVWYSSNENVASVTSFGTVLAKNVSNRQTVMIYAIYKNDPSIILVKSFIIDPYDGESIIIQKNMNVGINQYKTINMPDELPYNFLQYYIWTSNDMTIAKVDQFGRICGINEGTCIVTGSYIYNLNVIVNIYITVS